MIDEKYLKECNLIFTGTNKIRDFCRVDFNLETAIINYDNCIALYDVAKNFNNLYMAFYYEYEKLEKLDLGEKVDFSWYSISGPNDIEPNSRMLALNVIKSKIVENYYSEILLKEYNGNITSFISYEDKDGYPNTDKIELDKKIVKKYIDLFEKHSLLLDMYKTMCGQLLISGQHYNLLSNFDEYYEKTTYGSKRVGKKPRILDGLSKLIFSIAPCYDIIFNLGENFGIDYENSTIDLKTSSEYNEDYNILVKKLFINTKVLKKD